MKTGYPIVYRPANATEQAAVPIGAFVIPVGETSVGVKSATGTVETFASSTASSLKKVSLTTAGANAVNLATHGGAEVHAEAGVTSVTMALTDFQISSVQQTGSFYLFNYTGNPLPVTLGVGWAGGISEDGDLTNDLAGAGTLVTIPHAKKVLIIFDANGWVRATLLGVEVTQTELDAGLALKADIGKGYAPDWAAATAVTANELRRATAIAGVFGLGQLIRSNSARTTGAAFDATEAGNWTAANAMTYSAVNPAMNGTASAGMFNTTSRGDHVHPTDTAKQDTVIDNGFVQAAWTSVTSLLGGLTIRQVIYPAALNNSGGSMAVRFTLDAGGSDLVIGSSYVGIKATSGDAYDFASSPAQVSVGGNLTFTVPANGTVTTDWIDLDVNDGDGLVISAKANSGPMDMVVGVAGMHFGYSKSGTDDATVNATGYAGGINSYGVSKVELKKNTRPHTHPTDTSRAAVTSLTDSSVNMKGRTLKAEAVEHDAALDTNNMTATGAWNLNANANMPDATSWYYLENFIHRNSSNVQSPTYQLQRATTLLATPVRSYIRTRVSGTWGAWLEVGALTATAPVADGTAAVGTGTTAARHDHVHPKDFTDWTTYTPVVTSESGAWSNYNINGRYRIVDRMLTVTFALTFTGTPTAASGFYVSLPSGLTMNASVMTGGAGWDTDHVGFGIIGDSGVVSGVPTIITSRTTTKVIVKYYNAAASSYLTCPGLTNGDPWGWTTSDTIAGQFTVPIVS